MDVDFLRTLSDSLPDGRILLVGPKDNPDPAIQSLQRMSNAGPAYRLPNCRLSRPRLTCSIMPYIDAPVTRAMQPLKLKEYFATGKPVVVRDLPANREWADALDLTATSDGICNRSLGSALFRVARRAAPGPPTSGQESWSAKAQRFSQIDLGDGITALGTSSEELAMPPTDERPPICA